MSFREAANNEDSKPHHFSECVELMKPEEADEVLPLEPHETYIQDNKRQESGAEKTESVKRGQLEKSQLCEKRHQFNDYKDDFNQYKQELEFTDVAEVKHGMLEGDEDKYNVAELEIEDVTDEEEVNVTSGNSVKDNNQEWVSMDVDKFGRSFYNTDENPLTEQIKSLKLKTLVEYLNTHKYDEIVEYARSTDGLINNELRRYIWPLLLNLDVHSKEKYQLIEDTEEVPRNVNKFKINNQEASLFLDDLNLNDHPLHKDEEQVKLDIKRSFTILNHIQSSFNSNVSSFTNIYSTEEINYLKRKLYNLIVKLLRKYPNLNYYQGFHDIASIILLVNFNQNDNKLDETSSFRLLEALTLNHLRDFMIADINLSLQHLKLIPTLLEIIDHKMFKLIKQLNSGFINTNGEYYDYNFYQGLSSILTIFSHDVENLNQLLILWDFSLSYNTVLINIYIYVAAIMTKKCQIFKSLGIKDEEGDYDWLSVDKDKLHSLLSSTNLFKNLLNSDLIKILNLAKYYYETYPLDKLSNSCFTFDLWFKEYNRESVLLTTSKPLELSTTINANTNTGNSSPFDITDDEDSKVAAGNDEGYNVMNSAINEESSVNSLQLIDKLDNVAEVINKQNQQMSKLLAYYASIEKKLFDSHLEESVTDFDNSETYGNSASNSLSSSISSLQTSTSSLNTRILKTSSMYFKKLLFSDYQDPNDEELSADGSNFNGDKDRKVPIIKWNKIFKLSTIYKISLTVGFLGFLLHFLLVKHNVNFNLINFTNKVLNESFNFLKNSSIVNGGFHSSKLGLGNIRNSIYGYMG